MICGQVSAPNVSARIFSLMHYRSAFPAQDEFLNFSGRGLGQIGDEVEGARHLEVRQRAAREIP
jgi:hypothetical protein